MIWWAPPCSVRIKCHSNKCKKCKTNLASPRLLWSFLTPFRAPSDLQMCYFYAVRLTDFKPRGRDSSLKRHTHHTHTHTRPRRALFLQMWCGQNSSNELTKWFTTWQETLLCSLSNSHLSSKCPWHFYPTTWMYYLPHRQHNLTPAKPNEFKCCWSVNYGSLMSECCLSDIEPEDSITPVLQERKISSFSFCFL